jgi:hypothetical protein
VLKLNENILYVWQLSNQFNFWITSLIHICQQLFISFIHPGFSKSRWRIFGSRRRLDMPQACGMSPSAVGMSGRRVREGGVPPLDWRGVRWSSSGIIWNSRWQEMQSGGFHWSQKCRIFRANILFENKNIHRSRFKKTHYKLYCVLPT